MYVTDQSVISVLTHLTGVFYKRFHNIYLQFTLNSTFILKGDTGSSAILSRVNILMVHCMLILR